MFFEIFEGGLEFGVQLLFAYAADDTGTGAIAAVAGATIGHKKQHAIRVTMHEAGHGHVGILTTGVRHVVGRSPGFLDPRDDLSPDRAVGIVSLDEIEEMWRDGEREFVPGKKHTG